ncbi:fluoride efflux transporter CrcB [Chryseobacterium sp. Leaf394]|uniref:fluoride efflux transporter CrcB n=1 Tax=Chryseobacterium sp. Leaf394 TaxID=1736361 RepID=UPI0006FFA864|nr:fluoride efflux transporter CrcB [Chryseobacterium sp. Leaf394]KQS92539.1 camphor resistance protein CrcB [Chryseobacterium sp. Leaf394]
MRNLFYIFIGGGVGSILRYLISFHTQKLWKISSFPVGTLAVNVLGCFMIGFLTSSLIKNDDGLKYLLITGLCGGFTTFSAFSIENYSLWESQQFGIMILYIALSVLLGIIAVFAGLKFQNLL